MLRLGFLIEGKNGPAWVIEILQKAILEKNIQCSIIIQTNELKDNAFENVFFRLFRKIDHRILPGKPHLSRTVELEIPEKAQLLRAELVKKGERYSLAPDDLSQVTKNKPDLLLYFGNRLLGEEILGLPKLGVWNLQFGMMGESRSINVPPGFWEWYFRMPVSAATVIQLGIGLASTKCIAQSCTRTDSVSFSRNQTTLFSLGVEVMVNALQKVAASQGFSGTTMPAHSPSESAKDKPGIGDALLSFCKLGYRTVSKLVSKLIFIEQWALFYSFSSPDVTQLRLEKFIPLIPPKDRFWADPFVITKGENHYLFIEELFWKTQKGHINCLIINQNGKILDSKTIIEKPYHLSYPYIFEHNKVWYMIPESADNKTVDLYECTDFPFGWKFKRSLLTDVEAYDSTLLFHEGLYWLFCTIKKSSGGSSDDHLFLFYSTDFLSEEWKQHPGNPIISNPYSARPAGRLFFHNNSWYRPSQICVPRYGYGLSLNKITELTATSYAEETVNTAKPVWRTDVLSVHTLNFTNEMTLIDGQLKRIKFGKG